MIKEFNIKSLKDRINEVNTFLSKYGNKELSFIEILERNSFQAHKEELLHKLRQQEEISRNEIIELRLFGHEMNGSLPLSLFSKISDHLSKSINYAASFIRYGEDPTKNAQDKISNDIDLRLSGISVGSTRVFISGNMLRDLAEIAEQEKGLLQETLESIFNLLKAEKKEDIKQTVSLIGPRATMHLRKLMQVMENQNIGASLKWNAPQSIIYNWGGNLESVRFAREKLLNDNALPPKKTAISGIISNLSDAGSIKIRSEDHKSQILIKYSNQQFLEVQKLSLGQFVSLNVMKFTHIDENTEKEKVTYRLITSEN